MELLSGNEACAIGAIRAGVKFFGGYPITPSTEIAEYMARELPKLGWGPAVVLDGRPFGFVALPQGGVSGMFRKETTVLIRITPNDNNSSWIIIMSF